ncbi:hypothetical protein IMSHALPRED_002306 [Imshaugia aleurites]|uniref:Heterokaryon incompatibility domain-containing protein n=1 Tax=Imshaugia aleurites TaxID=172621 RepID=A0A8H3F002_9LECA|nr:hypothetical protein IMSHALPRED_002306 [Imshaugia aleurites]
MGSNYRCAQRVVVWLGPNSERSDVAITFLQDIGSTVPETSYSSSQNTIGKSDFGRISPGTKYRLPKADAIQWSGLRELIRCRWFARLWIVYEVFLNDNVIVQCGNTTFPWSDIENFSHQVMNSSFLMRLMREEQHNENPYIHEGTSAYLLASSITEYRKQNERDRVLDWVMAAFAVQTASDPRDYIYALLCLVSPAEASLIEPIYRAPVADVFTHFTRTIIDKQGRWGFLHRVQWTGSSDMGLPSWVVTRDALRGG